MYPDNVEQKNSKELSVHRRFLFLAALIYFVWWFAVEIILPNSFNPFLSRFLVICFPLLALVASYKSDVGRRYTLINFYASAWLISLHYFYLFYKNNGAIEWLIGSYVAYMATSVVYASRNSLLFYSVYFVILAFILNYLLKTSLDLIFIPGLLTIVIQANISLNSKLKVIKTLKDSNERFQLLFNSTFEGILVHENGIIIDANEALAKMTGYTKKEIIGQELLDFVHPDERLITSKNIRLKDVITVETKGYTKSGETVDIEVRAKDIKYDKRVVRLVTVQDISDRKRSEKDKIAALSLQENARVRDEFISLASHELKTPISSLKLKTQIFERQIKQNDPKVLTAPHLNGIIALFNNQINRLNELVDSMIDVSRISTGGLRLEFNNFDLPLMIREVESSLRGHQDPKQSRFYLDLPDTLMLKADCERIKQVLENLLKNALKYGEEKPIQVRVFKESSQAVIVISDHGLGIKQESIHRIFDRFERAVSSENISGLGLGLYIVKHIVEAHKGMISVESELNVGSVFTVKLPLNTETV